VEYRIRRLKTQEQRKGLTVSRSFGRLLTRPEPIKEALLQFVGRAGPPAAMGRKFTVRPSDVHYPHEDKRLAVFQTAEKMGYTSR
jgi:hypothetical protein